MKRFKIQLPPHMQLRISLEELSFYWEKDAIETLSAAFNQKNIPYKVKQTEYGKVFINFQEGELGVIVTI